MRPQLVCFVLQQKTAYGMRISDWSSDVCSSDLLDLRQHLVGEAGAHHEAGMAGGAAEIHQPALGEQDDPLAVGELDLVDLRLDVVPFQVAQRADLDLAVEMADVEIGRAHV